MSRRIELINDNQVVIVNLLALKKLFNGQVRSTVLGDPLHKVNVLDSSVIETNLFKGLHIK